MPRPAAAATASQCTRTLNDGAPGTALASPVALTPASNSAQRIVNLGTDRSARVIQDVVVTADKPLPASVTPQQVNFDAVISRSGDTVESEDFPSPTFSPPRISPDRQSITFDICLNPGSIPAGQYVGAVTVSGPLGLGTASVSLTVNAQNGTFFIVGVVLALIIAFVLLVLKDAVAVRGKSEAPGALTFGKWLLAPFSDPIWWVATIAALGAAFGALFGTYSSDPSWGSGGLIASIVPLIGASLAAIGGQTVLSSFRT